ncbi:MAG: ATP-binding protein [Anaerolineae bacterium]|nr:ATP-binding protein [Anaerolineae bacterium]
MERECLRIACVFDEIARACEFAQNAALGMGSSDLEAYHCYLAVDEACTNIVEHGRRGESPVEACIEVCFQQEGARLTLIISDDSSPFDPLAQPDPDPASGLDGRGSGGWGIYFIKRLMDEVRYVHEDGRNHLILSKWIRQMPDSALSIAATRLPIAVATSGAKLVKIAPSGRYDARCANLLSDEVGRWTDAGRSQFIIDMSGVSHISSSGLKLLVNLWQRARERRTRIILARIPTHIRELMEVSGLDLIFSTAETLEQAEAILTK